MKLEKIIDIFPPPVEGEPAFDPDLIESNVERLKTSPVINTGNELIDRAIKIGLAHIDATFQGNHPKYGIKFYAKTQHDSFPPVIISTVDALTLWGINKRAKELFRYWIMNFIKEDGTIDYYAPSISEYGQLLNISYLLIERAGTDGWWDDCFPKLKKVVDYLMFLYRKAEKENTLVSGCPEADEVKNSGKYFHNNAWLSKGLERWAEILHNQNVSKNISEEEIKTASRKLADVTIKGIKEVWPVNSKDWWLPPCIEKVEKPENLTSSRIASYTNYRYWPELLSSGILPRSMADRIIKARINKNGQFYGTTRFEDHLDDWPLADYLYGLWQIGRKNEFYISLFGHIFYYQAKGHLTAYEQVSLPPGRELGAYCLPCQLVATRAGRLINKKN